MKIKSIKIEIAGEDKELTLEQARELHQELGELLDKNVTAPIVLQPFNPYWSIYPPYRITCGEVGSTGGGAPITTTTSGGSLFGFSVKKGEPS